MMLPRLIPICTVALLSVTAVAGQDAAQEVQEGNVKQWVEYYERERRQTDEADVRREAASEPGQATSENGTQSGDVQKSQEVITRPND